MTLLSRHVIKVNVQQTSAMFQPMDFSVLGDLTPFINVGIPNTRSASMAKMVVNQGSEKMIYNATHTNPRYKNFQSCERITKFLVKNADRKIKVHPKAAKRCPVKVQSHPYSII